MMYFYTVELNGALNLVGTSRCYHNTVNIYSLLFLSTVLSI